MKSFGRSELKSRHSGYAGNAGGLCPELKRKNAQWTSVHLVEPRIGSVPRAVRPASLLRIPVLSGRSLQTILFLRPWQRAYRRLDTKFLSTPPNAITGITATAPARTGSQRKIHPILTGLTGVFANVTEAMAPHMGNG